MALENVGVNFVANGGDVYITTLDKSTKATNTFVSATEQGGGRVSAAGQVMIGALREVGKIATQAFLEAGKAAIGFVKSSIDVAGDFEQGMHKFQAVAGSAVDTKGLEKFKDLFISLGKELPVSTSEVEQAAIEMVSGGIDPAIVAGGALRQTIQFAAASGLSLADAAATSAKFLAGWTSSAATAEEKIAFLTSSTDALTKAAAASSTTAAELRLGIFNVQGAAQALHAPFADVVATLAELAPAFESSAQAGTALNVFMSRLVPQTNKAEDAMYALGLITKNGQNVFFDSRGNFLGMANAAQVLKEKLGGLTDEQKIDTLHQLFGNDAMKVGNLLMQDGAAGIDAMKAKMDAANGVSATAALMQSGYNTALENAKGSVEALQITIGSYLIPVLTDLLNNWIAPGVNAITDWVNAIMKADDPVLAFTQSLDNLMPVLGGVVGGVRDAIAEFSQLSTAFNTGGISGLIDQLIGDIGAALPDIEAALLDWGQAFVDWIDPMIPPVLTALGDAVDQAWAWVKQQAPAWIDQLRVWGQALIDWIEPYIPPMLKMLGGLVADAWGWVKQQAPEWARQLLAWGNELVKWVAPMIPPALVELGKLGAQFLGWIGAQAAPLLAKFQDWAKSFVAWIPGATVTFLAEWPKTFDKFLNWIGSEAGPLLKKMGDWAISFIGWIAPMIPPFLVALGGIALAIGTWVIETAAVLTKKIVEVWVPAILGWIVTDAIPGLVRALDSFLKVFDGWIKDAQDALAREMIAVGKAIIDGIVNGIESASGRMMSTLKGLASNALKAAKDALGISSPSTLFMPVGASVVEGIMEGMSGMLPSLTNLVASLGQDLVSQAKDIADAVNGAIADSFGVTATVDRQIARNFSRLKDVGSEFLQDYIQQSLSAEQKIAEAFTDPKAGAAYFKMVSDNIFETAALQQKIDEAKTQREKDQLQQQLILISRAQDAEKQQFYANQVGAVNPMQAIADQIRQLLSNTAMPGILDNDTVRMLNGLLSQLEAMPLRAFGGPVDAGKPYWVGEDGPELFWPGQSGMVMPAATSMQMMMGGATTNNNQQTSYNMPIYTNQSPAVLQQSMAIMQASMI